MEIEARYVIPDRATRRKLASLRQLGAYTLVPRDEMRIADHYVDTAERSLQAQGWACRLRCTDGAWSVTLKGPAESDGDITTRLELEVPIAAASLDIDSWPDGDLRRLMGDLTAGATLEEILVIAQRRTPIAVHEGRREVAELTLDRLSVRAGGLRHRSHILECELSSDGRPDDLRHLTDLLRQDHRLIPEPRSKLQRALELIDLTRRAGGGDHKAIAPEELAALYSVDLAGARYRAEVAERLFDALSSQHRLAPRNRTLVRTAALLCEVGRVVDYCRPTRAGRDILLHEPLDGLDDEERRILAAAVYLQRGKASGKRLRKAFPEPLSRARRREALLVAALVRLVCALTVAPGEQPFVQGVVHEGDSVRITLYGPQAQRDARRTRKRSDLWTPLVGKGLRWEAVDVAPERQVGLRREDTMQRAGARVIEFHTTQMLAHEAGTREGEDPEELHDMRVAIRRLRSALSLFGPYLRGDNTDQVADHLRQAARVLGAVRDLDVNIEQARAYAQQHDGPAVPGMSALISEWEGFRQARRSEMLTYLDSAEYGELVDGLRELVALQSQPPREGEAPTTVAEAAVAYVRVYWNTVLAYRDVIATAPIPLLHALRIECKRLRYTLEFFEEVLAPEAASVLREVVRMQDHLGSMHDAAVTADALAAFLERRAASAADSLRGVSDYLADRRALVDRLHQATPKAWRRLTRKRIRRAVRRILS